MLLESNIIRRDSEQKQDPVNEYYKYCNDQRILDIKNVQELSSLLGLDLLTRTLQEKKHSNFGSFTELSDMYKTVNIKCARISLGAIYSYRKNEVRSCYCDQFSCARCRPYLKQKLLEKIEFEVADKGLYNHLMITTAGKEYRDKNDFQKSFKDMSKTWNKIRGAIAYYLKKRGKRFSYIQLPRSQRSGYCHPHILTNAFIPKKVLEKILNRYDNTGFFRIKQNKDVTNYLMLDFKKDHEWYIPTERKHFTCSRDIDLKIHRRETDEFWKDENLHIKYVRDPNKKLIDQAYDQINEKFHYPIPYSEILGNFYTELPTPAGADPDVVLKYPDPVDNEIWNNVPYLGFGELLGGMVEND